MFTVLLQQITIHRDGDIISELYHSRVSKHAISSGSFLFSFKYAINFFAKKSVLNLFPYNAENPGLYKDNDSRPSGSSGGKATDTKKPDGVGAGRREAASDEFMLQRFRKREKFRGLRR
jgi:hypothetical protein